MTTINRASRGVCVLLATATILVGCTTLDPYTRDQKTSNATKGALIGAAAGAVVGLVSGDDAVERRQRALLLAGVGALAGGSIGYYMDIQEAKLRQELEGTGVSVTRIGENITLNMPGNVTFATDSSDLNGNFYSVLNSVGKVVNEFEQTVIEVAGHTDSRGSESYNQSLSERRAGSVASYLRTRDVLGDRVITVGMGELRPVADNSSEQGQQTNRRVELTLVPLTG
jgi:outer membrane protein OmpA-like peptidoglycan-associated protein